MAEPSFGTYSPYIVGASYGTDAFAQIAQGIVASKRAKAVSDYNARVIEEESRAAAQAQTIEALQYERQVAIAAQDALLLEQASTYQQARMREHHARTLAETRAIVASSGLLMTGSPLRVYEETARAQEREVLAVQYQTRLQQRALRMQQTDAEYAAALARYGAGERLRVGGTQAAATRALRDDTQVLTGLTRAGGTLLEGAGATMLARERRKTQGPTLREPYAYTRATTPQTPFVFTGSR